MCERRRWPSGRGLTILYLIVSAAVSVVAGPLVPAQAQPLSTNDAERRDAAIEAARSGNYETALAALHVLADIYPDALELSHDLVTVLAWSEDDAGTVELAASLIPEAAPRYTQLAVAKAARNIARFEFALRWYDAALAADHNDLDARMGRLMAGADAGDVPGTRERLLELESFATSAELAAADQLAIDLASAYSLRMIGESLLALGAYESILNVFPSQQEALRGKALVLRDLLIPGPALELAAQYPGILTETEAERLRADEAAIRLRLVARTPYPGSEQDAATQAVLSLIDQELSVADMPSVRDALQLDRVVALSDSGQAEAAITQFEALPEDLRMHHPYVLAAAAQSYMQLQEPEKALVLLDRALEIEPTHLASRFRKAYALLDLDRYEEAIEIADALNAELPMTNRSPGDIVVKANGPRLRAEALGGYAEASGDQLATAQKRFETLLEQAPNNSEWRQELANVYRWRGWRDRSLAEYRQVLAADGELLSSRVGLAHAELDARLYASVETTVSDISSTHSRNTGVQGLAERWEIHNDREVTVRASTGDSSGPVSGVNNYAVDVRYYTTPIAHRYRIFVATHDAYAEFAEGESRRRRIGSGLEFRAPNVTATGLVSASRSGGDTGFSVETDVRLNDYWSLASGFASNSDNIQLRAHRLGIDADRVHLRARFAPHELASVSMGFERAEYSDSNVLANAYVDGRYRFMNGPRAKLDVVAGLARGSTDTSAVPYFSPVSDRTATLALEHRLRIWRRYDRRLTHVTGARVGRYAQQGFVSDSIWSLSYRLDWTVSNRHSLGFEVQRHGQLYDGVREHATVASFALSSRF